MESLPHLKNSPSKKVLIILEHTLKKGRLNLSHHDSTLKFKGEVLPVESELELNVYTGNLANTYLLKIKFTVPGNETCDNIEIKFFIQEKTVIPYSYRYKVRRVHYKINLEEIDPIVPTRVCWSAELMSEMGKIIRVTETILDAFVKK